MKQILLLFLVLFTATLKAQSFPYKNVELLKNKEVTIIETHESSVTDGYSEFYSDKYYIKRYMKADSGYMSRRDALIGKKFKVLDIGPAGSDFWLTLQGEDNSICYYQYRPTMLLMNYPFNVTGGLDLPDNFYCSYFKKESYTAKEVYVAQIHKIHIFKRVEDGVVRYTFVINEFLQTDGRAGKGFALIMEDGTQISQPKFPIEPQYHDGVNYKYFHSFDPTPEEMKILASKKIISAKFIDHFVTINWGEQIQGIFKCLIDNPKL